LETTAFQYTHGAKNPKQISPDNWTFDQTFLDRPGNATVVLVHGAWADGSSLLGMRTLVP
jgi:hypothetical protein